MRLVTALACLALVLSASLCFAGDSGKKKDKQTMSKGNSECMQKCEEQKQQCFGQYTRSDSMHGTYITPEGHKICWESFHACKGNCPK